MIRVALRRLGAVPSRGKWQELLFLPLHSPPPPLVTPRAPIPTLLVNVESNVKSAAQSLPIVTSLIATVTFVAAFTVPGGYSNNGPDEGMPAFIRKASLQAFVLLNTLAFCCSMVATVLLIYANTYPEDNFLISHVLKTSACISLVAVLATVSAFMTAVFALTSKECLWVAIVALFLGCTVPIILLSYPKLVELRRDAVRKQRNEYLSTSSRMVKEKLP
ncbi:hypothetical protein MRB53_021211 [Persea americana]|uniref:Uncharacterized protein n=1 Tax=Persea americana TaxID=3435 RepID=A0ACC2L378_PERAE|nr:hypothetical protein MRB53_021211 [Persea americana]